MHSSDKFELYGVPSDHIESIWGIVLLLIEKTLPYSDNKYTTPFLKEKLLNKQMQLWIVTKNAMIIAYSITQITIYPTHKRLCLLFLGGSEFLKWAHFLPKVLNWSKEHGCTAVELYGRTGWERWLRRYGFEKIQVVYRLVL